MKRKDYFMMILCFLSLTMAINCGDNDDSEDTSQLRPQNKIAFQSARDGNVEIYVTQVAI